MSPDGIQPGVLEEVVDIIASLLLVIFEKSWCSEKVSTRWKSCYHEMPCLVDEGRKGDAVLFQL